MPVILGAKAQAGFDQPLELMKDCHRRIEQFRDVLLRVARGACILDDQRRRALGAALTYFREAAPRHTADEEESLFPRLRQCAGDEVHSILQRLAGLESDHLRATTLHDRCNAIIGKWLFEGQISETSRRELVDQLHTLCELYRAHIAMEDESIFPVAAKALHAQELTAIGGEMKLRRNPRTVPTAPISRPSADAKETS